MDFLDPKKRKAHRTKLFIGYALVALALTFSSIILLYQSYGYDYDSKTGQIVRNGLVFVEAQPDGAEVFLNGASKGRTDLRLDIASGDYSLELRQNGYRSWQRDFTLEGGGVEQFIYPRLFPVDLVTSDTQNYTANPGLVTQSPDRQLVLVQQTGSYERFDLLDISGDSAAASTVALPDGLLTATGNNHVLSLVEWSADNHRLIINHAFDSGNEFVLVDIEAPGSSVNLTESFNVAFTDISLRDKKFDQYYLHDAASASLYTATDGVATPTLYQAGVLAYQPHGADVVAYITAAGASAGKVALKVREGADAYTVREFAAGSRYLVDLARFSNSWYIAGGVAEEHKVYLFKNPVAAIKDAHEKSPLPVAVLRTPGNGEYVSFSANTRFVALQSGNDLAVYDAENDRQYRYDTGLELTAGQKLEWMDGHRFAAVAGGQAVVFDYDGINQQKLTTAVAGFTPLFNQDYNAMFTISPSLKGDGLPALVRTELEVSN